MIRLSIILTSLILISCNQTKEDQHSEANAVSESEFVAVSLASIKEVYVPIEIKTTGLIRSNSSTKYSFKIGGVINQLKVDEGDKIKKGQLIASLKLTEIDAQLQQVQLGLDKAKRDFDRVESLYLDSIATLEDYENTKTQYELAEEAVALVNFNKKYASIYANSNGYVSKKLANPGEVIGPGSPIIISSDARGDYGWILECSVNDRQWTQISEGDSAFVKLDAYPKSELMGVVKSKSFQSDPVSGAFTIEVSVQPRGLQLAEGLFGSVNIRTKYNDQYLSLPFDAVTEANGKKGFVYLPGGDTIAIKKAVDLEKIHKDGIYISGGVEAQDNIIISNSSFLSDGSRIRVIETSNDQN